MTFAPQRSIQDRPDVLDLVRELFSRLPEYRHYEPWELQWLLFALNYCDGLIPEGEISGALEALRVEGEVLI
jgi:hypothetical protein